jgi:hypothetical protein
MDGSSGVPGMHKEKSVVWDGNGHDLKSVVFVLLELEESRRGVSVARLLSLYVSSRIRRFIWVSIVHWNTRQAV